MSGFCLYRLKRSRNDQLLFNRYVKILKNPENKNLAKKN